MIFFFYMAFFALVVVTCFAWLLIPRRKIDKPARAELDPVLLRQARRRHRKT